MNCHSVLFANASFLEPVRASFRDNRPQHWIRFHDLPDFVYFNHSIHMKKGIGCMRERMHDRRLSVSGDHQAAPHVILKILMAVDATLSATSARRSSTRGRSKRSRSISAPHCRRSSTT
jgi:hypothetical protein